MHKLSVMYGLLFNPGNIRTDWRYFCHLSHESPYLSIVSKRLKRTVKTFRLFIPGRNKCVCWSKSWDQKIPRRTMVNSSENKRQVDILVHVSHGKGQSNKKINQDKPLSHCLIQKQCWRLSYSELVNFLLHFCVPHILHNVQILPLGDAPLNIMIPFFSY